MLKLDNVNVKTQDGFIVKDASIKLESDECLSVLGPSGSGKSSLMQVICGLIKPTSGQVYYKEKPIYNYDIYEYRKNVRYIPARPDFFTGTVDNHLKTIISHLDLNQDKAMQEIKEYLEKFFLEQNILQKKTSDISTGEGKRIFLIQNLLIKAEIYVLDEVFSGLDPELMEKGFSTVKNLCKSIIITSHNIEFLKKVSHRSLFISNGEIIEHTNNFFTNTGNKNVIRYLKGGN